MIGILGGTFDPIHFGHLRPALEVAENLALSELRFLPCANPPHRRPPQADALQRLAMVRAAVAAEPRFRVDDRELRRGGLSYMVDTLVSLRTELGGTPLCLLLGADAFAALDTWHEWERIPDLAHLIVMQRPEQEPAVGALSASLRELVRQRKTEDVAGLNQKPAGDVCFVTVTQLAISATEIRRVLREGRSIRFLVPAVVEQLIEMQRIYA
ncbi:MAG: nicotinate-nucleotide adenylyltransferase [Gammaproteobacteria bacterium SG8_47]|nr:MAG: nicotinate-nucleotide adenylyltransferase [Gammaproteobacteria bacterium SG8_47]